MAKDIFTSTTIAGRTSKWQIQELGLFRRKLTWITMKLHITSLNSHFAPQESQHQMLRRKKAEPRTPHLLSLKPGYCSLVSRGKVCIKVCNVDFLPIWVNKNCETESALIKKSPEVGNNGADPMLTQNRSVLRRDVKPTYQKHTQKVKPVLPLINTRCCEWF